MVELQMRDPPLRWSCPRCRLQWLDTGEGFFGQRYSRCLRCGTDASEPDDTELRSSDRPSAGPAVLAC